MRTSNVLATLAQLAGRQFAGPAALPAAVGALRDAIGFDLALFISTDSHAEATDCQIVIGPDIRPVLHRYFSEYANTQETAYIASFREVLLSTAPYDSSDLYGGRYQDSPLYHEVGRQAGCYHYLRWPIRDAGKPVGCLFLARPPHGRPFSDKDKTFIRRATPPLTHALLRRDWGNGEVDSLVDSGEEGYVICDNKGAIQHLSGRARTLLHLASGMPASVARLKDHTLTWARPLLHQVAVRLADPPSASPPVCTVRNASGTYLLRAYRLSGVHPGVPEQVMVQISRHIPLALKMLATPKMRTLPGRDQEIAILLAAGHTSREIADRLKITPIAWPIMCAPFSTASILAAGKICLPLC